MDAKLKVATTKLENVELLYAGSFKPVNWQGKAWEVTPAILREIVDNTLARIKAGESVNAIIDHDVDNDGVLDAMKSLSFGRIVDLTLEDRTNGPTVVATFDAVPEKFADMVSAGMLDKRSIEGGRGDNGWVLDAVAFFGAGKPAVAGLNSLAKDLFRADDSNRIAARDSALPGTDCGTFKVRLQGAKTSEGNEMADKEMAEVLAENAKLKAEIESAVKLREAQEENTRKLADAEKAIADMAIKLKAADEERAAIMLLREKEEEAKCVAFVDAEVAAGHVQPAKRDAVIAMLKEMPAEHADTVKELITSKPSDVLLKEKLPAMEAPKAYDDVKARVAAYLKENNMPDTFDNYTHAVRTLGFSKEV